MDRTLSGATTLDQSGDISVRWFNVISRTLIEGFLPFYRDVVTMYSQFLVLEKKKCFPELGPSMDNFGLQASPSSYRLKIRTYIVDIMF